jgi:hypothetical protein
MDWETYAEYSEAKLIEANSNITRKAKLIEALKAECDAADEMMIGYTKHSHPAMSYNTHQIEHSDYDEWHAARAARLKIEEKE